MFSYGFAAGLSVGFIMTVVALKYFDRQYPKPSAWVDGRVPHVKRKVERKKPIVIDEFKEYQMEQDRLKEERPAVP